MAASEADQAAATQTMGPAPPPSTGPTNMSEFLEDLNRVPLFMTELDDSDGAGGSNQDLEALRSLAYDGVPSEIAANFKSQGNDLVQVKRWADAREFYTKALDVLRPRAAEPSGPADLKAKLEAPVGPREVDWLDSVGGSGGDESRVVDVEDEEQKQADLEEACAVNRALCNLQLKNYGQATRDCARALRLNPKNTKAYYRSASALLAVDKTAPAIQAIQLGLSHEPSNEALKTLLARVQGRHQALARVEEERRARLQEVNAEAFALKEGLRRRGIAVTSSGDKRPDMEDARVALADPSDPESELQTPVLLLYPTAGQSELIKEVREADTIADLLSMVLPVPFDGAEDFGPATGESVECFVETGSGGLRKAGKKVQWGRIIKDGGCVLRDGLCQVFVVPKTKSDAWLLEYKRRAGKG